jgi:hypothetical protein
MAGLPNKRIRLARSRQEALPPIIVARNTLMAVLGAVLLVLKDRYSGPGFSLVHAYAGNFVASFAVYFIVSLAVHPFKRPRLVAALASLLAVSAFEITHGYGFMSNVYDPVDLLANATGIALAVIVDSASSHMIGRRNDRGTTAAT